MRLVDVDALLSKNCIRLKGPNDGEYDSCSECLGEPYGYCCMEMKGDEIYNEPTFDAIPVEWLEQQRECNDPESVKDINGAFVTICIDGVLALWRKEQEGDDETDRRRRAGEKMLHKQRRI